VTKLFPPATALLFVLLPAAAPTAAAATLYVDSSNLCPGTGAQADPYCRIQGAICHAASGDQVSVAPGTYRESIRMKPGVSVFSVQGAAITTIDGTGRTCIQGASTPPDPANDFCAPLPGSVQCSVVVFGSDFTTADRLDGGDGLGSTFRAEIVDDDRRALRREQP